MSENTEKPDDDRRLTEDDLNRLRGEGSDAADIPVLNCNKEDCHVATNEFDTSPDDGDHQ